MNYYDNEVEDLCKAMLKAQQAFDDYWESVEIDGAYYSLEMKGYILTSEGFEKLKEVTMNLNGTGKEEFIVNEK